MTPADDLAGSIIRIGTQWTVVRSTAPGSLSVFGKLTDQQPAPPAKFEILERYLNSPAPSADAPRAITRPAKAR